MNRDDGAESLAIVWQYIWRGLVIFGLALAVIGGCGSVEPAQSLVAPGHEAAVDAGGAADVVTQVDLAPADVSPCALPGHFCPIGGSQ